MEQESSLVYGVGDEVFIGITTVVITVISVIFLTKRCQPRFGLNIHPESLQGVEDARQHIPRHAAAVDGAMPRFRRNENDSQCPICLGTARYAVETNCGHLFCGQCVIMYWRHGVWLGAIRCPVCRQQVTLLLQCFTEAEHNSAEIDDVQERQNTIQECHAYNRRFSGEPRPMMDYIRDLPTLLRHLWSEFFSVGGLMYMFRIRIILCFCAACIYLISPLDIIPEAIFGILGLLDDVFVVLLLAIYISIIYRRFLANRAHGHNNNNNGVM